MNEKKDQLDQEILRKLQEDAAKKEPPIAGIYAGPDFFAQRAGQPVRFDGIDMRDQGRPVGMVRNDNTEKEAPIKASKAKFCPECGTKFEEGQNVCKSCGYVAEGDK